MEMRKDLEEQGEAEGGPLSVNQVVAQAAKRPQSQLQKYCLVSGVVLSYDQAQTQSLAVLKKNVENINPKTRLVECRYRNQLKEGKLSAAQGFAHLENDCSVEKLHLVDS